MNSEFECLTKGAEIDTLEMVIKSAVQAAFGNLLESQGAPRKVNPDECREAWLWIESDDEESPLSFINCARNAGYDPFSFRELLHAQWRHARHQPENRTRYGKLFVSPLTTRNQVDQLLRSAPPPIRVAVTDVQQFSLYL